MKLKLLAGVLAVLVQGVCLAADTPWTPIMFGAGGHDLKIRIVSDVTTNEVNFWKWKDAVNFTTVSYPNLIISDRFYINEEKPFPRTNTSVVHWEVYSNTYAIASLDGQTNTIAEAHVKLGDYRKATSTITTTLTNTVEAVSFEAVRAVP